MSPVLVGAVAFALVVVALIVLVVCLPGGSRAPARGAVRRGSRWRRGTRGRKPAGRPDAAVPVKMPRPIEDIVSDARRYASRVHEPPRGTSYAKHVAWCTVYDRVLGEACAALEIEHLLGVLPPGDERDAERTRIETALWLAGLRLEDAA